MANQNQNTQSLTEVLRSPMVKKRFDDILGNNSGSFMSTILTIVNNSSRLKMCSTGTILSAASTAAALKLPITPSLGFAYIVPYKVKDGYQAQFQIGWKGLVQLAQRSNLYHRLHAGKVYEGQIEDIDFITGDPIRGKKISDNVVGYIAYMELINGFTKTLYMSMDELREHAKKYSQSYAYDVKYNRATSVWSTNFDAMAKKTVLKQLLSKYGIMNVDANSTDMARALAADQSVIRSDGTYHYVDNDRSRKMEMADIEDNVNDELEAIPSHEDMVNEENTFDRIEPDIDEEIGGVTDSVEFAESVEYTIPPEE